MGRIVSICLLLFFSHPAIFAGNDTTLHVVKEKTVAGNFCNFYIDNLGNIFLVTANNQIKKLDQHFDSVALFNDVRRYGDVYSIDVNNPLKILLYYRDFTTILVLDRFLNTRNTIDLRSAGILQAKAITQSYDNNYWVFDELNNRLKKIDDNGNVLLESADFRILFSYEYNPQRIIDTDGGLYLYDIKNGWLIFDYYGTYKKHIVETGWKDVSVSRNILSGRDSVLFYTTSATTFNNLKIKTDLDIAAAIKIQWQSTRMFVLTKDNLSVYSVQ
ncbi:MAG: hypothetical protein ABI861_02835 [Panacibacter sp.]